MNKILESQSRGTASSDYLDSLQPKIGITPVDKEFPLNLNSESKITNHSGKMLEKTMAPHSSTLAWKIPWME